ncbi:MAG: S9 family peptidase [Anaerolineae bacterium]|nr:S9 family peptidase [Anaerolineae bacterium]
MVANARAYETPPWVQRFRAPTVLWTSLAEDAPTRGVAASNRSGVYQLYAWDVTGGDLRQVTDEAQGVVFGSISPDGQHIYHFDDQAGNETGHWVRVPFAGGEPENVTPGLDDYNPLYLGFSRNMRAMGLTTPTLDGFKMYVIPLDETGGIGKPRLLYRARPISFGPYLAYDADTAIVATTERSGTMDYNLLAFDIASGEQIAELWDEGASVEAVAFAPLPGDTRLLATTNRTGSKRPVIWNPRTGERLDLPLPELDGEVSVIDWSPDGSRLLLVHMQRAVQQLYVYDLTHQALNRLDHAPGTYGLGGSTGLYFASDAEIFASWQNSETPLSVIALDSRTGEQTRVVLEATAQPEGRRAQSILFPSSDGQEIQAWLIVPAGEGPFPTVIETHGGPFSVATDEFSPSAMTWVDHGFAYCSVNYRGSVTFGKAFEHQIYNDLGHWEVEDIVAARQWLVEHGITHPDQVLLTGWSYGGYLTLQSLGKYPDLWAGGMAGIAIADWVLSHADSSNTLRAVQESLLGGTPADQPEQYRLSSPITYVEAVRAPVLIIQGKNDTRTPARPVKRYEQKMRDLGKDITVHWFETGHLGSFADSELAIDHHERMLAFAFRVLDRAMWPLSPPPLAPPPK